MKILKKNENIEKIENIEMLLKILKKIEKIENICFVAYVRALREPWDSQNTAVGTDNIFAFVMSKHTTNMGKMNWFCDCFTHYSDGADEPQHYSPVGMCISNLPQKCCLNIAY